MPVPAVIGLNAIGVVVEAVRVFVFDEILFRYDVKSADRAVTDFHSPQGPVIPPAGGGNHPLQDRGWKA